MLVAYFVSSHQNPHRYINIPHGFGFCDKSVSCWSLLCLYLTFCCCSSSPKLRENLLTGGLSPLHRPNYSGSPFLTIVGYPLPTKLLPSLGAVILRQRSAKSKSPIAYDTIPCPSRNWRLAFCRRHPEVKVRRLKAVDWKRHDFQIYDKITDWFDVIGKELRAPTILREKVYNTDETGILLSAPTSLNVLVGRDDLRNYRGAGVQRTLVTAIECISADGRSLAPLIIWPAATQRSTWTTHPTPDWHFACSQTGYTNSAISLEWVQKVIDLSTRSRANGKPRVLISDGFSTHESLEVKTFCYENNIILCRLPCHTSHKLQPCDVGVFGPLKTAYREQIERLFRRGANTVGKQHFTWLYNRARQIAITPHNIRSGWSKAGLFPFSAERVLRDMPKPQQVANNYEQTPTREEICPRPNSPLKIPTIAMSLDGMLCKAETHFAIADDDTRLYF